MVTPEQNSKKTPPLKKIEFKKVEKKIELNINLQDWINKNLVYIIVGLLFVPFLFSVITGNKREPISMTQLVKDVREEKVEKISVAGAELRADYKDKAKKIARKEDGQQVVSLLVASEIDLAQVDVEIVNVSSTQLIWELLLNF